MEIFTLVGKMAIDGLDKTKGQLGDLEKKTQRVQKGLKVMGAAFTAVGAAGLALIQSTKAMNAQLGVTALNLGVSTKEMRKLALEATNVTFPLGEVLASFDLLARAGVEDQQVLKDTATAFDTLGDATGYTASQVTEMMVPAMKTFGLSAEEMAKKTDMMTYMSRESTMSMEDFNTMVGYTTPELVEAGLTMEDLTAILIHMEKKGFAPGRVMTREFNKAVTQATKDQIPLTEAIGITTEEMEGYKKELDGATGMTQKYADVANEQFTIMDKIKQKFSEITLGMSGFLEPLEPILAGMTALGPVMLIVATNTKIATLATRLFGIAWKVALGPIGWAIAAVGLLTTAGVLLYQNWDKVSHALGMAWANIKIYFLEGVEDVLKTLEKFTSFIPGLGDKVKEAREAISGMLDVERMDKQVLRMNRALKTTKDAIDANKEAAVNLAGAIDPDLILAQEAEREELEKTLVALEEQKSAYESLLEKAQDATKEFEYQRSEAGKLGITTKDVTEALISQGWSARDLANMWQLIGDDVKYADSYLERVGLTAAEVNDILGRQKDEVEKLGDAYDGLGDAADRASGSMGKLPSHIPQPTLPQSEWLQTGVAEQKTDFLGWPVERLLNHILSTPSDEIASGGVQGAADVLRQFLTPEGLKAFNQWYLAQAVGGSEGWATGNIAMSEQVRRIGEQAPRVPEAVIPLSKESLERLGLSGGGPSILITNNTFNVRDDRDIDRIAKGIIDRIRQKAGVRF